MTGRASHKASPLASAFLKADTRQYTLEIEAIPGGLLAEGRWAPRIRIRIEIDTDPPPGTPREPDLPAADPLFGPDPGPAGSARREAARPPLPEVLPPGEGARLVRPGLVCGERPGGEPRPPGGETPPERSDSGRRATDRGGAPEDGGQGDQDPGRGRGAAGSPPLPDGRRGARGLVARVLPGRLRPDSGGRSRSMLCRIDNG